MMFPPAVIVHSHAMARAALLCHRPVTLLSAEDAASFAGVGWWQALMAMVRAEFPDAEIVDILDCGDAPGRALEALRAGQKVLILQAEDAVFADIAARAAEMDALVLASAPKALDLAHPRAEAGLAAWLSGQAGE